MESNYTSNYQLCQWSKDDKVLRTEFNADNAWTIVNSLSTFLPSIELLD